MRRFHLATLLLLSASACSGDAADPVAGGAGTLDGSTPDATKVVTDASNDEDLETDAGADAAAEEAGSAKPDTCTFDDPPDDAGFDSNCDGAEGVIERSIYVAQSGDDIFGGSPSYPVKTLARALALEPRILILDEAVSALDKSVEAQVLNLLLDLKDEFGLTYIFNSHDLEVVRFMSTRVLVMYLGKVVELGPTQSLYTGSCHPYTTALLGSMLSMDPDRRTLEAPLAGDPPNPINPPSGCRFRTRCVDAEAVCSAVEPAISAAGLDHSAACHMVIAGSGHSQARGKAA